MSASKTGHQLLSFFCCPTGGRLKCREYLILANIKSATRLIKGKFSENAGSQQCLLHVTTFQRRVNRHAAEQSEHSQNDGSLKHGAQESGVDHKTHLDAPRGINGSLA